MPPSPVFSLISLYPAFFLSGAATLLFEVVWIRRLTLHLGSSPLSFALVSSLSIAGLGAGALLFPRLSHSLLKSRRQAPAILEAGFGAASFVLLRFLPGYPASLFLCAALSGAVVASVLARRDPAAEGGGGAGPGSLFGAHFLGAAIGSAAGGFLFLPHLGANATTTLALAVSILSLPFYAHACRVPLARTGGGARRAGNRSPELLPAAMVFLTGASGLGIQVLWGRWISQMAGSSAYTYYSILTVAILAFAAGCLLGAGNRRIGGGVGGTARWAGAAICSTAYPAALLPVLLAASETGISPFRHLASWGVGPPSAAFLLALLILAPPLAASGMMFSRFASRVGGHPEREAACFFSNCLGASAGALAVPFLLVPAAGMGLALVIVCAVNAVPAAAALSSGGKGADPPRGRAALLSAILPVLGAAAFLLWNRPAFFLLPQTLAAYGGRADASPPFRAGGWGFYREGAWTTVLVGGTGGREILVVDGKPESGAVRDRPTQAMLAHLPFLLRGGPPGDVLLIGLGSGVTLETVLLHGPRRVDCVEISPEVVSAAREAYGIGRAAAISDPRVRMRIGDGRRHLREAGKRYDLILSQPSNPWVMGASSLFTREAFLEMASSLSPSGVAVLWFQAYGISGEDVQREVDTIRSVFPEILFFSFTPGDILAACSFVPLSLDAGKIGAAMAASSRIRASLESAGVAGPPDVLGGFFGGSSREGPPAAGDGGGRWNTDDRPSLEYSVAASMPRRDPYPAYDRILQPLPVRASYLRGFPGRGDPGWSALAVEWGEGYARKGFARFAGDLFEEALARGGRSARLLNDLGVVCLERNDYNGAVSRFEEAIALDPGNQPARENLAALKGGAFDANR